MCASGIYISGLLIAVLSGGFNFSRMAWILSILLQDPLAALNMPLVGALQR
jgi:hypothetical protein